eukprot:TRINITY_DN4559_c0_g1_i1.p1 TRINITY_DN4559_c0_g1~~TRINITY_DN4559_c0_g1_i1.p1  ORF type:complete len:328 (-),score=51.91 TRINITY_DN4559_c0_g1_i1:157-1140(-)
MNAFFNKLFGSGDAKAVEPLGADVPSNLPPEELKRIEEEHKNSKYGGVLVPYDSDFLDSSNTINAWKYLGQRRVAPEEVEGVRLVMDWEQPKPEGYTRFVAISDTHTKTANLQLPQADILLHAGDFTNTGEPEGVRGFVEFLRGLDYSHKIVIAGNHDLTFDLANYPRIGPNFHRKNMFDAAATKDILLSAGHNIVYLEDALFETRGFKIYGSPWQPEFFDWGFNETRGQRLRDRWALIPNHIDILITHGPPLGHGDRCQDGFLAGCTDLLRVIQQRAKPKVHVFGHIHEGYGVTSDGHTLYVNASTCNLRYQSNQRPIVFDLPNKS